MAVSDNNPELFCKELVKEEGDKERKLNMCLWMIQYNRNEWKSSILKMKDTYLNEWLKLCGCLAGGDLEKGDVEARQYLVSLKSDLQDKSDFLSEDTLNKLIEIPGVIESWLDAKGSKLWTRNLYRK